MSGTGGRSTPIAIWGASGHARVVAELVQLSDQFEIAAVIDDHSPAAPDRLFDVPVVRSRDELLERRARGLRYAIVAIGDCDARRATAAWLRAQGFCLPVLVHPRAVVSATAEIGAGTVVAAGAVVNPGARIGMDAIINTAATVDHDCVIGDAVHISPGAHLGGGVRIGDGTWIGIGAVVSHGIAVGAHSMVGAGAVVVRDLPDHVLAYGVPARVVRKRD